MVPLTDPVFLLLENSSIKTFIDTQSKVFWAKYKAANIIRSRELILLEKAKAKVVIICPTKTVFKAL